MKEIRTLSQLLNALEHGYRIPKNHDATMLSQSAAHCPKKEERHFCVSIAGHIIGIDSMYSETYSLCKGYLCENEPEVYISINDDDIAFERAEAEKLHIIQKARDLEALALYRKISEAMLDYDTFLMHGAVIAEGENAFLFTAKSGTGKTTHIRKWLNNLENAYVVNGDKPLIRITEREAIACGTPWCGKEKMGTNCMIPLKAVVMMERGTENEIHEITFDEAFAFLLQQTYLPVETEMKKKTLKLISQMNGKVKCYRYIFNNMKADAFSISYEALAGGNK